MKEIKTAELTGPALDWAVARAKGIPAEELYVQNWGSAGKSLYRRNRDEDGKLDGTYTTGPDMLFSRKWEAGGPIIEREKIRISPNLNRTWSAQIRHTTTHPLVAHPVLAGWTNKHGPTPLIAAMRCYVAAKMGDTIEIPKELLT